MSNLWNGNEKTGSMYSVSPAHLLPSVTHILAAYVSILSVFLPIATPRHIISRFKPSKIIRPNAVKRAF